VERKEKVLLVGDNPFHGISHLSQERGRVRGDSSTDVEHAASLVLASLENGANGFMFSVSGTTLAVLRTIRARKENVPPVLYAIVPYMYEYVRLATQLGGVPGLVRKLGREIIMSWNLRAIAMGLEAALKRDPLSIMKTYLTYEISRIRASAGRHADLHSVLLHQTVTDMALALELDWVFEAFIDFMLRCGITPGFNTGNFPYLVNKFKEWKIDLSNVTIAAPFNEAGFQMSPSKTECEEVLAANPQAFVIAISVFAAGYLKPGEAIDYIAALDGIKGLAIGVSKEEHARETFTILKQKLS
jgi:hypothetical protein